MKLGKRMLISAFVSVLIFLFLAFKSDFLNGEIILLSIVCSGLFGTVGLCVYGVWRVLGVILYKGIIRGLAALIGGFAIFCTITDFFTPFLNSLPEFVSIIIMIVYSILYYIGACFMISIGSCE